MKTKEKILHTARRLFNERGLAQVTLRTIAGEMGISQGNLNYHFRKRQEIIEGLYFELVEQMDQGMRQIVSGELDMGFLVGSNVYLYEQLYAYRFLMLDFVQVMRENDQIRLHYQQLQAMRTQQFAMMVLLFQQKGWIREEEFDQEYDRLYKRMNILGDFWIAFGEITEEEFSEKDCLTYSMLLVENIYPYLTPAGKAAFLSAKEEILQ